MASPVRALCEAFTIDIANGAAVATGVNLGGRIPVGIYMPAAWTAAGLTFATSTDGLTWYSLQSAGVELTVAASAGVYVSLTPEPFLGVEWIRIQSGTIGTPVNQAAARTMVLMAGQPDL